MNSRKLGSICVALAAWVFVPTEVSAQPRYTAPTISGYLNNTYTFGISGAFVNSDTDFRNVGSSNGTTGAICADGTVNFWDTALRYAGEFSGIRIAAAASACQGFGTASEQVGGFEGKTTLGTLFTGGVRIIVPVNLNGFMMMPSAGVGWGIGNVKIEAAPFESDRSWRSGPYFELGVAFPLSNWTGGTTPTTGGAANERIWGAGTTQNINAAATELYLNYKRWDAGDQTLDGGARTDTVFNLYTAGVRAKF
jgi:hypothetical protein